MKRLIGVLAALALMSGALSASAEDIVLEGRSLEELYGLRERLERQITALEQADDGVTVDAGPYQVGRDIPAGDYVVTENQDAMFASVMVRESADEASALVSHDLVNGQCVIRLREGTWVTLNEVVAVPIAQAAPISDGIVPEGSYLVGSQLPAGRYAVTPVEGAPLASYSIYDGILGTDAQLLKFEVLRESAEIILIDGEYIELSGSRLAIDPED